MHGGRINSAMTLADLSVAAQGTERLGRPLAEVIQELNASASVRSIFERLTRREPLTVGEFFLRNDLHRRMSTGVSQPVLVHLFKTWLLQEKQLHVQPQPHRSARLGLGDLSLCIEYDTKFNCFELRGTVVVDGQNIPLVQIVDAIRQKRNWFKTPSGDYARLSPSFVTALSPIVYADCHDAAFQLGVAATPMLADLASQVGSIVANDRWSDFVARFQSAEEKAIAVPAQLTAKLRDYQLDGFRWMSRLAEWGAGACLADDMGLGKTVQTLALLVSRQAKGPALVVAPSSVVHTWLNEAVKFAPTLKLHLFHETDRHLEQLKPSDVVVCSWTLFARESELFHSVRFGTVVFDEAQAMKNAATQRAQAAHQIQSDFVVALSGTPIENHIGELWSLFRCVMPSLLGSEASFRERFAGDDREATRALSKMIQPFILRRSKSQVAKELPAKTEIDLLIPLTDAERALYDDIRLNALAQLAEGNVEKQRFQVLAAITRLRLAACHARLVDANWKGPTSKLDRLVDLIRDISDAGHKVLVFSQFTLHLGLVESALRDQGFQYSYLDGQIPTAERQRRVTQFQEGRGGTAFLISLKAGGTGLTLTAADYVIHLDPWWNPAVEDQASDRSHRIGQTRPVTVYRLIAEGTIEQEILSLHASKRELVDAVLEGTDAAGKLSAAQLMNLISATPRS